MGSIWPQGVLARRGHPGLAQAGVGLRVQRLRQRVHRVLGLVHPTALLARRRQGILQRDPEVKRAVADREFRSGARPAFAQREQHIPLRLPALAHVIVDREKFLLAIGRRPDHHEDACALPRQASASSPPSSRSTLGAATCWRSVSRRSSPPRTAADDRRCYLRRTDPDRTSRPLNRRSAVECAVALHRHWAATRVPPSEIRPEEPESDLRRLAQTVTPTIGTMRAVLKARLDPPPTAAPMRPCSSCPFARRCASDSAAQAVAAVVS